MSHVRCPVSGVGGQEDILKVDFFAHGQNLSFEILRKKKCKNITKKSLNMCETWRINLWKRLKFINFYFAHANLKVLRTGRNFCCSRMTVRFWLLETLVSGVMCHVSCIRCHVYFFFLIFIRLFLDKLVGLVCEGAYAISFCFYLIYICFAGVPRSVGGSPSDVEWPEGREVQHGGCL